MNYYKRHIGDYMKDASHLNLLEHGVYMRLLDVYYTREGGIPVDQAARLIGARSRDERAALDVVVGEFFSISEGLYRQGRCDAEIASMQLKAETNREVGKRGGRPKKVTVVVAAGADAGFPDVTGMVPFDADFGNPEITQTVSFFNPNETLATSHKPITNNQTHTMPDQSTGGAGAPGSVCVSVCQKMQEVGIGDANAGDGTLALLVDRGAGVDAFVEAARLAVGKGKGFGYAVGVVKNRMAEAAAAASVAMAAPAAAPVAVVSAGRPDVSRVTVPMAPNADAALRALDADAAIPRSGPPPEVLALRAKFKRPAVAASAGVGAGA